MPSKLCVWTFGVQSGHEILVRSFFFPWGDGLNEYCPKMHWVLSLREAFHDPAEETLYLVVPIHKIQKALNKVYPSAQKTIPPNLQNFRTHYNLGVRGRFFVRQGNCSFIGLLNLFWFQLLPWLLTQLTCTEHFQSWLKNCHLCTVCHNSGKSVPTNQCCH